MSHTLDHQALSMACPSCDLIYDMSGLKDGDRANCHRCGHRLTTYRADELHRVIAYGSSALIMLLLSCSFPFLSFKASGLESVITLPQTVYKLWLNNMPDLAVLVGAFILGVPALVLGMMIWMAVHLIRKQPHPWLPLVGRIVFTLQAWSMVEVFFIGVLVSLVKIAKMATVVMGVSFWSYGAFFILFTMTLATLDRYQCWRRIDALESSDVKHEVKDADR
ncbi:paraquat-inducible protein A [Maricurvus nonylphenolicus]|uniref:paraquat-inducible protein A n=1 Tax=Maricurvus nonylphenolicus TaxID=1008307 RepID=UPI0036F2796C